MPRINNKARTAPLPNAQEMEDTSSPAGLGGKGVGVEWERVAVAISGARSCAVGGRICAKGVAVAVGVGVGTAV